MNEDFSEFKQEMLEAQDDYKLKAIIDKDEMADKFDAIIKKHRIKMPCVDTFYKLEFHNDFIITYHRIERE